MVGQASHCEAALDDIGRPADSRGELHPDISDQVVLIVDNYALLATDTAYAVSELGFGTMTATTSAAVLALIEQHDSITILVADMLLSGHVDGMALIAEARKIRPDLAVILTSVFSSPNLNRMPDRVVFLLKPHTRKALCSALMICAGVADDLE